MPNAPIANYHSFLAETFKRLGRLETLLWGHYNGRASTPTLKISTGYDPGFHIWAFAHSGDQEALNKMEEQIADYKTRNPD